MKKVLAMLLSVSLLCSLLGCGSSSSASSSANSENTSSASGQASSAKTTFGLKPLAQETTLNLGFFAGSPLSYPFLFADKEGFFKDLNIKVNYQSFTNGNAMMEANKDWDMAGCGEGGLLAGMLGYDVHVIGVSDYEHKISLYARKGSKLATDPKNPANWKGTKWLGPVGTTGQAVLVAGLKNVGLKLSDVSCLNMDISSALTAYLGGQGDGLVVWNAVAWSAEDSGLVEVGNSKMLNFTSPCAMLATTKSLKEKPELITDAYVVFYKTIEWMYSSQENFDKCVQYYLEDCQDQGIKCDKSVAERVMKTYAPPKTLKDSIDLFVKTGKDNAGKYTQRDLLQAENDVMVGLDFFISQGTYTQAQRDKILDNHLVDPTIALAAQKLAS